MFRNRKEAANLLADKLQPYSKTAGIVLAIPRGGIPIGYEIAQKLDWPLDVAMSKKIGHPTNKEYAIGAVSLTGYVFNHEVDVPNGYIEREAERIREELMNKYHQYMANKEAAPTTDKVVVLADDGVATGQTLLSIIDLVRREKPKKLIVAIPVSSPDALSKIEAQADEVICLLTPENFRSVGQFYEDFEQVTDEEVMDKLHSSRNTHIHSPTSSASAEKSRGSAGRDRSIKNKNPQVNSRDSKS